MRRATLALALALLLFLVLPIQPATAGSAVRDCRQHATTPASVAALIRCAAPRIGVSTSRALYVANRESHFRPVVCNSSDHCGVFQDARAIWSYISSRYVYGRAMDSLLGGGCTVGNLTHWGRCSGRASVILNLRFVLHHGWSPWGF